MSGDKKIYYFEVSLSLPAIWKQNIYTYHSDEVLEIGRIVFVPFGPSTKAGYISSLVNKPEYKTKQISSVTEYRLNSKTLEFLSWMTIYYPGAPGIHIQHFIPSFLKNNPKPRTVPDEIVKLATAHKLNEHQINAFNRLTSANSTKSNVLHGITGSGKTLLYCELAKKTLDSGKNALILYPEISLTAQLEKTLIDFFGSETVSVYHSKRTKSEQRKTWMKIHNSDNSYVCIGPRSALFLPHHNLGLVVVDEAHDSAYKQDSGIRYSGLVAAGALAKKHSAQIILGSATPPVQETEQIISKEGSLVCMHDLAKGNNKDSKNFTVVDMTKQNNRSNSQLLSKSLLKSIKLSLFNKKQVLLFLNKRGTARMLLCEECGWHAECPNCESPMTHHHDSFLLQCNICGMKKKSVVICPECSSSLSLKSPGIKSVEQDLLQLFPQAKIARFDSDNKKQDTFSENYQHIKSGGADIIIGTQLLTKGLDLPLLETVGILQADSALLLPDFSSEERSFQQLTQVSGRVGRGHSVGNIIVQTYQPDNYIFKYVMSQDWHGFYNQELIKRKHSGYPPYSFAMKVWVNKKSRENAIKYIGMFKEKISTNKNIKILGPAPSFYEKVAGNYSWQIIVFSSSRLELAKIANNLDKDFYYDLDPNSLL